MQNISTMIGDCTFTLIGGQFCGGYFWETACGNYIEVEEVYPAICPCCLRPVLMNDN